MGVPEISTIELDACLKRGEKLVLLDVREGEELELSKLEGVVHIPMGQMADRCGELDKGADIVVICRTGGRSGRVAEFLVGQGFKNVRNMVGGMNGWADTVDPSVTKY